MAASTVDLSEFTEMIGARDQRRPCKVAEPLAALSEGDRVKVEAAFATDIVVIPSGAIEKWFAARGHSVSNQAIAQHRKGRCRCADVRS